MTRVLGIIGQPRTLPNSGTVVQQVALNGNRIGKILTIGPNSTYKNLGLTEILARPGFPNHPGVGTRVDITGTIYKDGEIFPGILNLPVAKFKQIMDAAKKSGRIELF